MRRALLLALPALLPGSVAAQTAQLVAEAGASRFLPPVGVEGEAANYLLAGLRGELLDAAGTGLAMSLLAGRATTDETGGDFLSGEAAAFLRGFLAPGWEVGGEARLSGFTVSDPVPYRAGALEGNAYLRWGTPRVSATLAGTAGWGTSTVDLFRYVDGPVVTVTDALWRYGATGELLVGGGAVAGGVSAGYHESAGGHFRSVGGRVVLGVGGGAVELRVDAWETPLGTETTGGIALAVPLGGWSLRGFLGRSEPDPLTLAEPGRGGGGLLVGRRIVGHGEPAVPALPRGEALHQVLSRTADGARVRFTLRAPDAGEVALLGDFTLWEPLAMTRDGGSWTVEVTVPAGTHHFGFTMDGEWHLPEDAPDAVPDEWGRRSATLVVEG